jgi:hypothetical protein
LVFASLHEYLLWRAILANLWTIPFDRFPLAASEVESLGHLDFYLSDSLLDPRFLLLVAYQTSYSSSQWGSRLLAAEKIGPSFGLPGHPPCWRTQYGDVPLRAGPSAGGLPGLTWIRCLRHDPHVGPLRCLTSSWNASWTPVPEILFTAFQRSRLYAEFRGQMR